MSKASNKKKLFPWILGVLVAIAGITTDIEKIVNSISGFFLKTESQPAASASTNSANNYIVNGSQNNYQNGNNNSYQNNYKPAKK